MRASVSVHADQVVTALTPSKGVGGHLNLTLLSFKVAISVCVYVSNHT